MPLVAHNDLPSFSRLRAEGYRIMSPARACEQDIRSLHIGLLNMMPDAALEATERQFFRLISSSNPISQFYVHPFTIDDIERGEKASAHIARYYESFDELQAHGIDALIVSGANVTQPDLSKDIFWKPLQTVFEWANEHVTSTLCSCLATHAFLLDRHRVARTHLGDKCWGVFDHSVVKNDHPLVQDINTRVSVPHSRFNEISASQFRQAGLHVLITGDEPEPGVQLAVSPDGFRTILFQGHPEYDSISLLKEYKREVYRYIHRYTDHYPRQPKHYFDRFSRAVLEEYEQRVTRARTDGVDVPTFPEHLLIPRLMNTWHDSAEALVGNWLGLVYQVTHADPSLPFMEGVDPNDPLGWLAGDTHRLF